MAEPTIKSIFVEVYAYRKIYQHLTSKLKTEVRKREKLRIQVALSTIKGWCEDGEKIFEKHRPGSKTVPAAKAKKLVQQKCVLHKKPRRINRTRVRLSR